MRLGMLMLRVSMAPKQPLRRRIECPFLDQKAFPKIKEPNIEASPKYISKQIQTFFRILSLLSGQTTLLSINTPTNTPAIAIKTEKIINRFQF